MGGAGNKSGAASEEFAMDMEQLVEIIDALARQKNPEWNAMLDAMEKTPLWEDQDVPCFEESFGQRKPSLAVLPAAGGKPRGAVIVCAGGAYYFKSVHEGRIVAERFQKAGFGAAVLDYRVKPYPPEVSLLDAQRAIRLLRARAARWNILPDQIAILGFSAGGHLAGMAATKFGPGDPEASDPVERVASRPDAIIQGYGSLTLASFPGKDSIMDTGNDRQRKVELSPDKNLRPDAPPFFLWQCSDDPLVDARQMLHMAKELIDYGIPVEMHLFPQGNHGLGLADGSLPGIPVNLHVAQWADLCIHWLNHLGF